MLTSMLNFCALFETTLIETRCLAMQLISSFLAFNLLVSNRVVVSSLAACEQS